MLLPSTLHQLLAPARAGKSSLLKVLAGRVPSNRFDGSVWYGGQPAKAVNVNRLVAFVGQSDVHLPLLTVRMCVLFVRTSKERAVCVGHPAGPRTLIQTALCTLHLST